MKTTGVHSTTEVHSQFWRESEKKWVDHVLIRTWGANRDHPKKWRHREVVTTIETKEWEDGKR